MSWEMVGKRCNELPQHILFNSYIIITLHYIITLWVIAIEALVKSDGKTMYYSVTKDVVKRTLLELI